MAARAKSKKQPESRASSPDRMSPKFEERHGELAGGSFVADVAEIDEKLRKMIWRVVERHAELDGHLPRVGPALAMFDGVFHHALHRFVAGDPHTSEELETQVIRVFHCVNSNVDEPSRDRAAHPQSRRKPPTHQRVR